MPSGKKLPFLLLLILACACLTACPRIPVKPSDTGGEIAAPDKWDAADSRLVAEEMIITMLSFPWIAKWRAINPRNPQPAVLVAGIGNPTREAVPVDTFVNDLKRAMVRSGAIKIVAGGESEEERRSKRPGQAFTATPETLAALARETDADFLLSGSIGSSVDQEDGVRVTVYQVDLGLTDMETGLKVWSGEKEIRKTRRTD